MHVKPSKFPPALTSEEEQILIEQYIQGDNSARNMLIERNLRLVAHIAKKFNNSRFDTDELIAIGCEGLVKGINKFDPAKAVKLSTYLSKCIENQILIRLRKYKTKEILDQSLESPIATDFDGNAITLLDILSDGNYGITKNNLLDSFSESSVEDLVIYKNDTELIFSNLIKWIDNLPKAEKHILLLRYFRNSPLTQREISEILGFSRSYVSRLERNALKKLKINLQKSKLL